MPPPDENLRRSALVALLWSLLQNWGGRAMASVVFIVLARLLRPAEFGIASSAFLVMSFLALVAELGFGDAIVQRRELEPADLNLPFFVSLGGASLLAIVVALLARPLSELLGVARLAPYLAGAAALSPLIVLSGFQEALYRRALRFRDLALRTLAGIVIGGVVGVGVALAGLGSWAVIAQFGAQTLVGIVWLWSRSEWYPRLHFNVGSFRSLAQFGGSVVGMRVVDFVTLRSVDLIILTVHGAAALGLFSVSSRLYQLLMQLFQASISSVGLSVLSKVAHDRERLARLFERSSSISAMIGTPVFFALAALAPEVNRIMFGPKWAGAEAVMRPLLLVGGLHCVQFTMGAYLTAVGRPQTLLRLMLLKAVLVLPPLLLFRGGSVAAVATIYACALAIELPFILHATLRSLAMNGRRLLRPVGVPFLASGMAFALVVLFRDFGGVRAGIYGNAALLAAIFALTYVSSMLLLAPAVVRENINFGWQTFRPPGMRPPS